LVSVAILQVIDLALLFIVMLYRVARIGRNAVGRNAERRPIYVDSIAKKTGGGCRHPPPRPARSIVDLPPLFRGHFRDLVPIIRAKQGPGASALQAAGIGLIRLVWKMKH